MGLPGLFAAFIKTNEEIRVEKDLPFSPGWSQPEFVQTDPFHQASLSLCKPGLTFFARLEPTRVLAGKAYSLSS